MFMGAAMNPEYFKERINIYVALAPVASTVHLDSAEIRLAAHMINEIEFTLVDLLRMYNWFAPVPDLVHTLEFVCHLLPDVCLWVSGLLHHDGVDNADRFDVFMSNEPPGASYRTFVYYAQQINSGEVRFYDYGRRKNKKIYG